MRIIWAWSIAAAAGVTALSIVGLVFFSTHDAGQEDAPLGARLELAGRSFDLGAVPADTPVERTVFFHNSGVTPLTVSIVKVRPAPDAACGCGVEGFEVRPETVPANGDGQLLFRLRVPEGMPDMEDVMIADLATNDPARPQLQISITFTMSN